MKKIEAKKERKVKKRKERRERRERKERKERREARKRKENKRDVLRHNFHIHSLTFNLVTENCLREIELLEDLSHSWIHDCRLPIPILLTLDS